MASLDHTTSINAVSQQFATLTPQNQDLSTASLQQEADIRDTTDLSIHHTQDS